MRIGGTFNATGADMYICLGFIPDFITIWNLEDTARVKLEWNKGMMGAAEAVEGFEVTAATQTAAANTKGTGVLPYYGGKVLSSTDAGTTTFGEGVYLKRDNYDYRRVNSASKGIVGDAVTEDINLWTLGSSTNNTGNLNGGGVTGTYIGEGSPICIDGKWYTIVGLSSNGEAANEVTLSHPAASGNIEFIGGMYDYKPMVAGEVTLDGFWIDSTADVITTDGIRCCFEAGTYSL